MTQHKQKEMPDRKYSICLLMKQRNIFFALLLTGKLVIITIKVKENWIPVLPVWA